VLKYVFREDEPIRLKAASKADAQVIGEALEAIRTRAGGELEPKDVVETARPASHPLHQHFEWDDSKAAEAFRLDQARSIIRIVRVVDEEHVDAPTRAFISVSAKNGTSYRAVADIKRSSDLQAALLDQAEKELRAFELRYKELKEICSIITTAREAIQRRRSSSKNETRAAA
jgi:hypothetical protein